MIAKTLKLKAIITCVDGKQLDVKFCSRYYNEALLADLPPLVDLCGENREFHTFVYGGPIFKKELEVKIGETVLRDNQFHFCDLVLE